MTNCDLEFEISDNARAIYEKFGNGNPVIDGAPLVPKLSALAMLQLGEASFVGMDGVNIKEEYIHKGHYSYWPLPYIFGPDMPFEDLMLTDDREQPIFNSKEMVEIEALYQARITQYEGAIRVARRIIESAPDEIWFLLYFD